MVRATSMMSVPGVIRIPAGAMVSRAAEDFVGASGDLAEPIGEHGRFAVVWPASADLGGTGPGSGGSTQHPHAVDRYLSPPRARPLLRHG